MRILHWSEYFWPYIGGVEVGARQVLPWLRQRGCDLVVVTGHHNLELADAETYGGIPVRRYPFAAVLSAGDLARLVYLRREIAELKRAFHPDLVHVHQVGPSVLLHLQTSGDAPTPTMVTLHTEPRSDALRGGTLYGSAVRSADWVTACSSAALAAAGRQAPEIVGRSSVIYNGLAPPDLPPSAPGFDPPSLLCLGRLVARKGFDVALHAVASLLPRFPRLRLVVAGDGPLRPRLESQARELGIGDRVDFIGWVDPDAVPGVIRSSSIVVVPSWSEGLPNVAIQAGQMARPVVATRVAGLPEVVLDGQTGLVVEAGDGRALAVAIGRLLDEPELAIAMGERARRRALELFTPERCADEYLTLFRKLVGGRGRAAS